LIENAKNIKNDELSTGSTKIDKNTLHKF